MLQKDDNAAGQEPEPQQPQTPQAGASGNDTEITKLRQEAAKWRTQYRDAQKQIKTLEPQATAFAELEEANKGEAQKLADSLAALQTQLATAQANASQAQNAQKLTVLATKAGVNADMLQYLDVSKFDLEDEEATLAALSALVPAKSTNSGGSANPARNNTGMGDDEMRAWYTGQGKTNYIFGDK